jgi:hypothetical protein
VTSSARRVLPLPCDTSATFDELSADMEINAVLATDEWLARLLQFFLLSDAALEKSLDQDDIKRFYGFLARFLVQREQVLSIFCNRIDAIQVAGA